MKNRPRKSSLLFKKAGFILKPNEPRALALAVRLISVLSEMGVQSIFETSVAQMKGARRLETGTLIREADLLLVLGGDGSLLSVVEKFVKSGKTKLPVIGINLGGLGFLTELTVEEAPQMIKKVLSGSWSHFDARPIFQVTVKSADGKTRSIHHVLNDAAINKGVLARMINIRVDAGEHYVTDFRADGAVVATSTGSTAYSISAGGPIVPPDVKAMVLTPICPHLLAYRPIVFSDKTVLKLKVSRAEDVFLTLDGHHSVALEDNDTVIVTNSTKKLWLVKKPERDYFEIMRAKLKLGAR